jgi:hypothetical protein
MEIGFPDFDFPPSRSRTGLPKIDLDADGIDIFRGLTIGQESKYIPDGTIFDWEAYTNLITNMKNLQKNKYELQNPSHDPQFETLLHFCNNDGHSINKEQFLAIVQKHNNMYIRYKQKIDPINSQIAKLNVQLKSAKNEVIRVSALRGKKPNFNNNLIISIENDIAYYQEQLQQIPTPLQNTLPFQTYNEYVAEIKKFDSANKAYLRQCNSINQQITELVHLILMEKWRASYVKYARVYNIDVALDSDDIFEICNLHHLEELECSQTWEFACPLDCCDSDSESGDYGDHTVKLEAWRCSYGSSVNCTVNKTNIEKLIGFITVSDLEEFVEINYS